MFLNLIKGYRMVLLHVLGAVAKLYLRLMGCSLGEDVVTGAIPVVFRSGNSKISIGDRTKLSSSVLQNPIGSGDRLVLAATGDNSKIVIGSNCGISCSTLYASMSITLGDYVNIGAGCKIMDTDFHPIGVSDRRLHVADQIKSAPIAIEDDVWLGGNTIVLKGVTIGKGSIIGAGSVVIRDIPPYSLAAGSPAKVVKKLEQIASEKLNDDL